MAEKLIWTELRRIVASRAGVSEKEANTFLSALYAEIVEALKTDKQVKINGLGIFKLQAVAPRKSVNVSTGETIILEGYNKVAFVPEAGVRELIEKGASPLPSPEGEGEKIDPIKKLGSQAEEIVDILGELGQSPKEEPAKDPEPEKPTPTRPKGKKKKAEPEPEPVVEPEPEPVVEPEPIVEQEPVKEPEPVFYAPEPQPEPEPEPEAPKKKEKKHHFLRDTLICVVILLLLLLVGYFFLRSQLGDFIDSIIPSNAQTEQVVAATDTTAAATPAPIEDIEEEELTAEQILAEFLEASGETEGSETPDDEIYEDLITIEPMHEASRLTWMSKRFYGTKAYWPYIYDANKDHISNPSKIEVGTPIRVPKLTEAQKDTTSAAYRQLLREAEEACRK